MNLQTNKHFVSKLDTKLSLLDKESLKEIYTNRTDQVSSIFLTEDLLYFGCTNSEVYSLDLYSLEKTLLFSHSEKTTSLFVLEGFLFVGMDNGKIVKYAIHEDEGERVYNPVEEYKHNTPISCVLYDGEDIVVSDEKKRLTLLPSRVQYDLSVTQTLYKGYVFTSERNRLFCKTRQAIGSVLEVEGKIHEFRFDEKGSVVFVRVYDKIQVYELNTKSLLKEIEGVFDCFFYCERSNRLVGWEKKEVRVVEGVLEGEYEEMKIKFNKLEMEVKKVGVEEEEPKRVIKITDIMKLKGVCKESRERSKDSKESRESRNLVDSPSSKKFKLKDLRKEERLRNLFKEEEKEEEIGVHTSVHTSPPSVHTPSLHTSSPSVHTSSPPPLVFPIQSRGGTLLYYSKEGALFSLKGKGSYRVELKFHNLSLPGIQIEDKACCSQGVFCGRAIALYSQDTLFFYKDSVLWSKRVRPKAVCLSDKFVVVYSSLVFFFTHTGEEVFNFHPQDVSCMSLMGSRLVLCGTSLTVVDDLTLSLSLPLPGVPSWCCLDDSLNIFYRIGRDIYSLSGGLSHRVVEGIDYPLVVVRNKLIYLKNVDHLLPTPHLEYKEISKGGREKNSDENSVKNRDSVDGDSVDSIDKSLVDDDKPKKYNPLIN